MVAWEGHSERVAVEQLRVLFNQLPIVLGTNVVIAGLVALVLHHAARPALVDGWAVTIALLSGIRYLLLRRSAGTAEGDLAGLRRRRNAAIVGSALSGIVWGAGGYLLFPAAVLDQMFLAFVFGGMSAGAAVTLSAYPPIFYVFIVPHLLPLGLRLFLQGSIEYSVMGTMVLVYGIAMTVIARNLNGTLTQSLRLRFAVEAKTRQLRDANDQLMTEIDERRRAEATLRLEKDFSDTLIHGSLEGIVAYDRELRCTAWNSAMEVHTGVARSAVFGKPILDIVPSFRGTDIERAMRQALDGVKTSIEGEFFVADTDRPVFYHAHHSPLRGRGNEIVGGIGFTHDITELRQAEAMLRQAQKMEAIGQLTGGMAHDFNNLLTAILGNLELLRATNLTDRQLKLVGSASHAADRGARLVEQLLAFARKQRLEPRAVDLNGIVTGTVELLSRTIGGSARLETELEPELWPVSADPTQIELALLNLTINARDAMPIGGRLLVGTRNATIRRGDPNGLAAGDYVVLTVSDDGQGMSEHVQAHAFEPFFTTKPKGKGSGLGLAQVYGIIRQLGGTVVLKSKLYEGTRIDMYLPRDAGDRAADAEGAGASSTLPAALSSRPG